MKSYELKPTFDNLFSSYCNDTIERNSDIFRFIDILNAVEDGCSIALEGNWGCGKTFFVKQVKMVMDAHNIHINHDSNDNTIDDIVNIRNNYYGDEPHELQPQVCVYYDAWEHDNDEDSVLSIVYSIMKSVGSDFSFKSYDFFEIGATILECFTPIKIDWSKIIKSLKSTSPLDVLKEKENIKSSIDDFFNSLLPEKGNRLVIFVDELDRCKPSYAVRLLERIKHYFNHDKITFVFSININELQHTIKNHYGSDFNGSRYLDRFFDLRVALPSPNIKKYYASLNFNERGYKYDKICDIVINLYGLELRDITKFLRLAKIAAYAPTHDSSANFPFSDGKALQFCLTYVLPIMLGLKLTNLDRYNDFIKGNDFTPLIEVAQLVDDSMFNYLLEYSETYDERHTDETLVTVEDKLKAVYEALFIKDYTVYIYSVKIGLTEFNSNHKELLLKTAGLLSQYTSTDID